VLETYPTSWQCSGSYNLRAQKGVFETISMDEVRNRVYTLNGSSAFDLLGGIPLPKQRLIYGVEAGDLLSLPTKSNSWRILREWDSNMTGLCFKMDIVYPLIFPGDDLIGKNHRSLPDVQMLRNMTIRFSSSPLVRERQCIEKDLGNVFHDQRQYTWCTGVTLCQMVE